MQLVDTREQSGPSWLPVLLHAYRVSGPPQSSGWDEKLRKWWVALKYVSHLIMVGALLCGDGLSGFPRRPVRSRLSEAQVSEPRHTCPGRKGSRLLTDKERRCGDRITVSSPSSLGNSAGCQHLRSLWAWRLLCTSSSSQPSDVSCRPLAVLPRLQTDPSQRHWWHQPPHWQSISLWRALVSTLSVVKSLCLFYLLL